MRALMFSLTLGIMLLSPLVAGETEEDRWSVEVELGADGWLSYRNPRFGFVLPVPPGMKALRPPQNGDGQAFETLDGQVRLLGWGSFNVDGFGDVNRRWADELKAPKRTITYKRKTDSWYVVSGVEEDGTGFYTRYHADPRYVCGWSIRYPQREEKKCQAWIERIAKAHQPRLGKGVDRVD